MLLLTALRAVAVSSADFQQGKGFAGDISEGKLSLMVLKALHGAASAAQQRRLRDILAARTTDVTLVREAVAILHDCGAGEETCQYVCPVSCLWVRAHTYWINIDSAVSSESITTGGTDAHAVIVACCG